LETQTNKIYLTRCKLNYRYRASRPLQETDAWGKRYLRPALREYSNFSPGYGQNRPKSPNSCFHYCWRVEFRSLLGARLR